MVDIRSFQKVQRDASFDIIWVGQISKKTNGNIQSDDNDYAAVQHKNKFIRLFRFLFDW